MAYEPQKLADHFGAYTARPTGSRLCTGSGFNPKGGHEAFITRRGFREFRSDGS
jgi:hypothetical protein